MTYHMTTPIDLRLVDLRAALVCASTEETRYYLNGALVQRDTSSKTVRVVATDGHRMFVAVHEDENSGEQVGVIIPRAVLAKLPKGRKAPRTVTLHEITGSEGDLEIVDARGEALTPRFKPINGQFPEWQRVVPKEPDGTPARFAPKLYGSMGDIAKLYGSETDMTIAHNGAGPALVSWKDERSFGVIMPLRDPPGDRKSATEIAGYLMGRVRSTVTD